MNSRSLPALPWRWFPLIQRARPPAQPLASRIGDLAETASRLSESPQAVQAAGICNNAALIASDCGLPDLVRELCWRQHEVLRRASLPPEDVVKLSLEPLLNLARQHIRDGHGDAALTMIGILYHAARERTDAVIDRQTVSMRNLTATPEARKEACTRLWAALLADGTRALAAAGRWRDAAARASSHRGIGTRLLDGRQVSIIALLHSGDAAEALGLTTGSTAAEDWEKTVQHLLRIACLRSAGHPSEAEVPRMLTAILDQLESAAPANAVFRVRAGIIARDLAHHAVPARFDRKLADIAAYDARAAQDVLACQRLRDAMPTARRLLKLVADSGLGAGTMPAPLYRELMTAVGLAQDCLRTPAASPRGDF